MWVLKKHRKISSGSLGNSFSSASQRIWVRSAPVGKKSVCPKVPQSPVALPIPPSLPPRLHTQSISHRELHFTWADLPPSCSAHLAAKLRPGGQKQVGFLAAAKSHLGKKFHFCIESQENPMSITRTLAKKHLQKTSGEERDSPTL